MNPIPKFKVGDIVKLLPYTGNMDTIENINLSRTAYDETRNSLKSLKIRDVRYNKYNEYGTVYYIGAHWLFHESRIVLANKIKIRY